MATARNPRGEAQQRVGDQYVARVLEPSPPASQDTTWYADHPPAAGSADRPVVSPVSSGDVRWADLVRDDPGLEPFAAERWLAPVKRLGPAPRDLLPAVEDLRRVAFYVVANARFDATGKIGLRYTAGGFGTPFYGHDEQVRVEGRVLVHQRGGEVRSTELTTLAAAAEFVGVEAASPGSIEFHDPPPIGDPSAELAVSDEAARFVGDWFGFSYLVLEELWVRAGSPSDTRVQLWPEHFDPALELGAADAGRRASFGASPGDADHPEPYLYVSPWEPQAGDFWADPVFGGASLSLSSLGSPGHDGARQYDAALAFFETGRRLLHHS